MDRWIKQLSNDQMIQSSRVWTRNQLFLKKLVSKSLRHRVFPTLPEDFTGEEEDKTEKDCIKKIIDFKKWKEAEEIGAIDFP